MSLRAPREPASGQLDHFRFDVDRVHAASTEPVENDLHADTAPAAELENGSAFDASATVWRWTSARVGLFRPTFPTRVSFIGLREPDTARSATAEPALASLQRLESVDADEEAPRLRGVPG